MTGSRLPRPAEERFWEKVNRNGPISPDGTQCWLWTGATHRSGYGIFAVGREAGRLRVYAHRFAYQLTYGPIPPDVKQLDHRCRNGSLGCVRPEHLRVLRLDPERGLRPDKQNQENRRGARRDSRSGIRGVMWSSQQQKWRVQVVHDRKRHHGGFFPLDQLAEAEAAAIALRNRLFTHNDVDRG